MATATVSLSSVLLTKTCGTWSYPSWDASSCAIDTYGRCQPTYTSTIPVGSLITAIEVSVNMYSGTAGYPGVGSVSLGAGLGGGVLLAPTTLNYSSTSYPLTATGLSIIASASTFADAINVLILNKESFYGCIHNCSVGSMTVTYTPRSGNLFFGSNF